MIEGSTQFTAPERMLQKTMQGFGWASIFACGAVVTMGACVALLNIKNRGKGNER